MRNIILLIFTLFILLISGCSNEIISQTKELQPVAKDEFFIDLPEDLPPDFDDVPPGLPDQDFGSISIINNPVQSISNIQGFATYNYRSSIFTLQNNTVAPMTTLVVQNNIGPMGVYKRAYLYRKGNVPVATIEICNATPRCFNSTNRITYYVGSSFPGGEYYMKIYDYSDPNKNNRWKKLYFNVTGGTVNQSFSYSISPSSTDISNPIRISVNPSNDGVFQKIYFYDSRNTLVGLHKLPCNSYKCYSNYTITYNLPSYWQNDFYTAKVYDYSRPKGQRWINQTFTITGSTHVRWGFFWVYSNQTGNNDRIAQFTPSKYGIYKDIFFYNSSNDLIRTISLPTNENRYFEEINLTFNTDEKLDNGFYNLKFFDYHRGYWRHINFTIY